MRSAIARKSSRGGRQSAADGTAVLAPKARRPSRRQRKSQPLCASRIRARRQPPQNRLTLVGESARCYSCATRTAARPATSRHDQRFKQEGSVAVRRPEARIQQRSLGARRCLITPRSACSAPVNARSEPWLFLCGLRVARGMRASSSAFVIDRDIGHVARAVGTTSARRIRATRPGGAVVQPGRQERRFFAAAVASRRGDEAVRGQPTRRRAPHRRRADEPCAIATSRIEGEGRG